MSSHRGDGRSESRVLAPRPPGSPPGASRAGASEGQRRAVVTRYGLLEAAGERFATAGYHGASLREILEVCGVTKGALYFHFPGKQALAGALIAECRGIWIRMTTEVQDRGLDPLQTLIASIEQFFTLMLTDPIVRGTVRLLNDPAVPFEHGRAHYDEAEAYVAAQLGAAAAAGALREAVDVQALARSITAAIAGHRLICDRSDVLDEIPSRIDAMWRALLPLVASERWLANQPIGRSREEPSHPR